VLHAYCNFHFFCISDLVVACVVVVVWGGDQEREGQGLVGVGGRVGEETLAVTMGRRGDR